MSYPDGVLGNKKIGFLAENLACEYLKKQGYKIIVRNYYINHGELDIVAKDKDELVIIEVKARYSHSFGYPEESITHWKLKSLKRTALIFLDDYNWYKKPWRMDLVALDFSESQIPQITHIKGIL